MRFLIVSIFLLLISQNASSHPSNESDLERCQGLHQLVCKHIKNLDFVLSKMTNETTSLDISQSFIKTLNLTLLRGFKTLRKISVTYSNLSNICGHLPHNILHLNLSRNELNLGNFLEEEDEDYVSDFNVEIIDLSYNLEREVLLHKVLFSLPHLKSLYLAGNNLEGQFVWGTMWEWINESKVLKDPDDTLCVFLKPYKIFSLLGCLRAKTDFEETCRKIDTGKCSSCVLYGLQKDLEDEFPNYPISHKGRHGSTSISLAVDCSNKSLRNFPVIPLQTWKLDLYLNFIKDLSPLKNFPYVIYLDVANNSVKIESLLGTPFLNDFMSLSLQHNDIRYIPDSFLKAVKNVQDMEEKGEGKFFLGFNNLECNCSTATNTKSLINSMRNPVPDWKEIYCGNLKTLDGSKNLPLKDLKMFDVCIIHKDTSPDQQIWIYLLIGAETILILVIVVKVWYDRRTFLRTGKLPWFSQKMPRLPCDAILEGFKNKGERRISIAINSQNSVHHLNNSRNCGGESTNSLKVKKGVVGVRFNIRSRSNSDCSEVTSNSSRGGEGSMCLLSGN